MEFYPSKLSFIIGRKGDNNSECKVVWERDMIICEMLKHCAFPSPLLSGPHSVWIYVAFATLTTIMHFMWAARNLGRAQLWGWNCPRKPSLSPAPNQEWKLLILTADTSRWSFQLLLPLFQPPAELRSLELPHHCLCRHLCQEFPKSGLYRSFLHPGCQYTSHPSRVSSAVPPEGEAAMLHI